MFLRSWIHTYIWIRVHGRVLIGLCTEARNDSVKIEIKASWRAPSAFTAGLTRLSGSRPPATTAAGACSPGPKWAAEQERCPHRGARVLPRRPRFIHSGDCRRTRARGAGGYWIPFGGGPVGGREDSGRPRGLGWACLSSGPTVPRPRLPPAGIRGAARTAFFLLRLLRLPAAPTGPGGRDSALLRGRAGASGFSAAPPAASSPSRHSRPPPAEETLAAREAREQRVQSGLVAPAPAPAPNAGPAPRPRRAMESAAPRRRHTHQRGYAVTRNPHLNKVSRPTQRWWGRARDRRGRPGGERREGRGAVGSPPSDSPKTHHARRCA